MTITGAIVLFSVIWFMGLLIALPLSLQSQDEAGDVAPGTSPSAPTNPQIRRKMFWVTVVTVALWLPLCGIIASGWISIADIDIWGRL
ncbi:DUF1467 family protein [Algicella marina]|uniref:DUF1467 family protein n=1 Tax=Algicella marina TaxID=2683284 RepID=A0A6P1T2W7_9RHOB|nr:DUF1467 family protein [Algicella marina]QHQ36081.1 DUF1467 family protein [Algicella marina]